MVAVAVGSYDGTVACLSFTTDSSERPVSVELLLPVSKDTALLLKARQELQKVFICRAHSGSVRAAASHGHWLATGSTDETIRLCDLRERSDIGTLIHHQGSITWLEFCGDWMYSASEDGNIAVWKTGTWECVTTLTGHKGPVVCMAVHPSGKLALSVGKDRILRTWNLSTGIAVFRQRLKQVAHQVQWNQSASLYALSFILNLKLYDSQTGDIVSTITTEQPLTSSVFISDEVVAVTSEQSMAVQLFSVCSGESVAELKGHTHRVKGLCAYPERNLLFSASSDGTVRAWNLTQPLRNSACVSVYDTGLRLNCICLALLSPPAKTAPTRTQADRDRDRDREDRERTKVSSRSKRCLRGSKRRRYRGHRGLISQLPFSHWRLHRTRHYKRNCVTRLRKQACIL